MTDRSDVHRAPRCAVKAELNAGELRQYLGGNIAAVACKLKAELPGSGSLPVLLAGNDDTDTERYVLIILRGNGHVDITVPAHRITFGKGEVHPAIEVSQAVRHDNIIADVIAGERQGSLPDSAHILRESCGGYALFACRCIAEISYALVYRRGVSPGYRELPAAVRKSGSRLVELALGNADLYGVGSCIDRCGVQGLIITVIVRYGYLACTLNCGGHCGVVLIAVKHQFCRNFNINIIHCKLFLIHVDSKVLCAFRREEFRAAVVINQRQGHIAHTVGDP